MHERNNPDHYEKNNSCRRAHVFLDPKQIKNPLTNVEANSYEFLILSDESLVDSKLKEESNHVAFKKLTKYQI